MSYSIDLPSKRLVASYVLDWIIILAIAAAGGGLNWVSPYHRPFSLLDLSISYPLVDESISSTTLGLAALMAPAVIIFLVVIFFVPGPHYVRTHSRSEVLRRKLWEWEKGWAGLALSLAMAFFVTQGLKNMFGKPRPDLLARCRPDLDDIAKYVVGGYGQDISEKWTLVNSGICSTTDRSALDDGFRSFPSGHSSFSWASMLYLALFLASKFAIAIPFLPERASSHDSETNKSDTHELLPLHLNSAPISGYRPRHKSDRSETSLPSQVSGREFARLAPLYNQAAAPPVWGIVIVFVPIAVAFYVVSTRYVEFYHHGFDIISGSLVGIIAAYVGFRWYHAPIRRGSGWAWGPRSRDRAFGIGVGTQNYVGSEGWESARGRQTLGMGNRR